VFTANASDALKLVGEAYLFEGWDVLLDAIAFAPTNPLN